MQEKILVYGSNSVICDALVKLGFKQIRCVNKLAEAVDLIRNGEFRIVLFEGTIHEFLKHKTKGVIFIIITRGVRDSYDAGFEACSKVSLQNFQKEFMKVLKENQQTA